MKEEKTNSAGKDIAVSASEANKTMSIVIPPPGARPPAEIVVQAMGAKPSADIVIPAPGAKPQQKAKPEPEKKPEIKAKPEPEKKPEIKAKPEPEKKPEPKASPEPEKKPQESEKLPQVRQPAEVKAPDRKKPLKPAKINSVAVEFQPDAVEIAMRPLPKLATMGIWLGIIFFFSALIAAYFCKVDVIVEGPGKLVSVEPNIVMKPLDRAVIKSVKVKVGQRVRKDEILFTFDPTINRVEEERLTSELNSYKAQYARWQAEFQKINYTADATKDERWQSAIFRQRKNFYTQKIRYFDEACRRIESSIHTTKQTVAQQEERLKKIDEITNMYVELLKKNATSRKDLLSIQMQKLQLEADITKLRNSIQESYHELEGQIAAKQTFIMEWQKDVSEQMVQVERYMISTTKSLEKVLQMNTYVVLRAPCDAIVHEIAQFPVGSAVREAEALITLVPINCPIELEAEIPARDIGKVKTGDQVRVKLNAFPFQKHGTLDGVVRNISEDTFQRESHGELDNPTFYRARIPLTGKLKYTHKNFRLIPGMEAQAEIKVGKRSVLEYVLYPLIKSLDEAIREP